MDREIKSAYRKRKEKNYGNMKMKRENGYSCKNTNTLVKIFCKSSLMYEYEVDVRIRTKRTE